MHITHERPEDAAAIRSVTDAAFRGVTHSDQNEAAIVEALRAAGMLTLSLVAIEAGEVVGHVAFSPVRINGGAGDWYGLGPASVAPARQRHGVGRALILDGLGRLASIGAAGCVVLGDPAYYRRFGFESDPGLFYGQAPAAFFQRLVFRGPGPKGEVTYHASFEAS